LAFFCPLSQKIDGGKPLAIKKTLPSMCLLEKEKFCLR
jgi:hypothetical protein